MVQSFEEAGWLRIAFSGRLDTARSAAIQEDVMQWVDASGLPVVFDMAGVEFVASAFLRLCITAAQHLGKGRLVLSNVNPMVRKVFAISGLDAHFAIK